MTTADTEALLDRLFKAYSAHDVAALAQLDTPDCAFAVAGVQLQGRDAVAAAWRAWFTAFPDVRSTIHRTLIDGRYAAVDWTERACIADACGCPASSCRPRGGACPGEG